jgi:hypothetical protein
LALGALAGLLALQQRLEQVPWQGAQAARVGLVPLLLLLVAAVAA